MSVLLDSEYARLYFEKLCVNWLICFREETQGTHFMSLLFSEFKLVSKYSWSRDFVLYVMFCILQVVSTEHAFFFPPVSNLQEPSRLHMFYMHQLNIYLIRFLLVIHSPPWRNSARSKDTSDSQAYCRCEFTVFCFCGEMF